MELEVLAIPECSKELQNRLHVGLRRTVHSQALAVYKSPKRHNQTPRVTEVSMRKINRLWYSGKFVVIG